MKRDVRHVGTSSGPVGWLGVNFWSRAGGPRMWSSYDPAVVAGELSVLQQHGLRTTRSFLYWPDFQPTPTIVDDRLLSRFEHFLDLHSELGLQTVPTFIVGHMSGQNWDPSWRGERDLYGDVWLVGRQAWFAGQVVKRLMDHPAIAGWLLSNEMPIYGRPPHQGLAPAPREQVTTWVQLLVDAVRAAGGTQPLGTGDGAWGVEMTGVENGFSVRDIAPLVDFIGPHVYPMGDDVVRQHLAAAFVCELAGCAGLPVVLEEFGVTSDFASDAEAGHFYRQTLHNSLLAGATGWLAWNNTDYDDLAAHEPYSHHPFEMHFGVTRSDGTPKAPLLELRDFGALLTDIDVEHCRRPDTAVAALVPAVVDTAIPFVNQADRAAPLASLRQAHVAAREADLPLALIRETDGIPVDLGLILLPSLKQVSAPTWARLDDFAQAGGTVYLSYFSGDHDEQRGSWHGDLDTRFGVRHQLRYGMTEPIVGDSVTFDFVEEFGPIAVADQLTFGVGGSSSARAFLPVEAVEATVVAVDAAARPALLRRSVGRGQLVLSTFPLEFMAASLPRVNPEPTYRLYDALAEVAGVRRDVRVEDPDVHVGELHHPDRGRYCWFISQAEESRRVVPVLADGLWLTERGGGPAVTKLTLPPFGVAVLRLHHSN